MIKLFTQKKPAFIKKPVNKTSNNKEKGIKVRFFDFHYIKEKLQILFKPKIYKKIYFYFSKFVKAILFYLYYFIAYNFLINYYRIIKKRNAAQYIILRNTISYGVIIFLSLITILYYIFSIVISFFQGSDQFFSSSIYFTPKILFVQSHEIFIYIFLVFIAFFSLINIAFLVSTNQSFGMLILGDKLVNNNDKKIPTWKLILYLLTIFFMLATFIVWPLFLAIWSTIFFINISFKINIIYKIFRIKTISIDNNYKKMIINTSYLNSKSSEKENIKYINSTKNYKSRLFASLPLIGNFLIYVVGFNAIFASLGIYKLLTTPLKFFTANFNLPAISSFIVTFFFGIKSAALSTFLNTNIKNAFFQFNNETGILTNSFIGSDGSISVSIDSQVYSETWHTKIHSWSNFWGDLKYIITVIAINNYYSPGTTIAWLFIFALSFWFILNFIFILLTGNSIFGLIIRGRKKVLLNKANHRQLTILGRAYYCANYLLWILFFFLPIVNIVWIVLNIYCFCVKKELLINLFTFTYYGKNEFKEQEKKEALLKSKEVLIKISSQLNLDKDNYESNI